MTTMMESLEKARKLLALHSEWRGKSQLRVRAQRVRKSGKIIIDVMELTHGKRVDDRVIVEVARNMARQVGSACVDACVLSDTMSTKLATNLKTGKQNTVKIRHSFFAFGGVE